MNPTRWAFVYTGIQRHEKQYADLLHASFGRVLGAHLIPIKDPETGKLRLPETFAEVQPVLMAIARPAFLSTIGDMIAKIGKEDEPVAEVGEVDDAPPIGLTTDTGMEILDGPIDISRMSEVERRQVLSVAGVEVVDRRTAEPLEGDVPGTQPTQPTRRSSFVLDD
jgi:hypothetical protein